jgi:tryptophan synthase alpha chain
VSRITGIFERLRAADRRALVGYLVAGDPTPAATVPAMHALAGNGVDVIELGMPFSDPEADGPDIQAGHERALAAGMRLSRIFDAVRDFRSRDDDTAVVLMGYVNVVERVGAEAFARWAAEAGVDGVILVNLPPEESAELRAAFEPFGIDLILLLAPTTTPERARLILSAASGFAYYVSLKGTTGAGHLDVDAVREKLAELRTLTELPLAVGFGIRDGASARAVAEFADAVVVGSAIVRRMGEGADDPDALPARLGAFAGELRQAMDARG